MGKASLELFAKGCLGSCWHGRYHYLEPWAGCGHACHYCYARSRSAVADRLQAFGAVYERPVPLYPPQELLSRIREGVKAHRVETAKLCRFTDILTPAFVRDGLARDVLAALLEAGVPRVIITTKGLPDERIMSLLKAHAGRVSYNAAFRPCRSLRLEPGLPPMKARLEAAAALKAAGLLVTAHLDPMVPGFDDDPAHLRPFLEGLKALGLDRVMFSYLLLNPSIQGRLSRVLPAADAARILAAYDLGAPRRVLANQEETDMFPVREEILLASARAVGTLLRGMGFEFVLCGLKSPAPAGAGDAPGCPSCDGTFYA